MWLFEQHLHSLPSEHELSHATIQSFVHQHGGSLHRNTTFQLLASHGYSAIAASFAREIEVYELAVAYYLHDHST